MGQNYSNLNSNSSSNSSNSSANDYQTMSSQPDSQYVVEEYDDFLTHEQCDYLIHLCNSKKQFIDSKVYASQNNDAIDTKVRDSQQTWLYDSDDSFVDELSKDISKWVNIPTKNFEALQVVRYGPGGFYKPHHDACVGSKEFCSRANQDFNGQQRYITFLIYLNDDFEGGGTHFPRINYTVKPKKGKAVMFYSVDAQGKVLPASLHGGNPVIKGNKWICNKWIHLPLEGHTPPTVPVESFEPIASPVYDTTRPTSVQKRICQSTFNGVGVL